MAPSNSASGRHQRSGIHTQRRIVVDDLDNAPPPPISVRYFYVSDLVIDDPKSPLIPAPAGSTVKTPARPFSFNDNQALEHAWKKLRRTQRSHQSKSQPAASQPESGNVSRTSTRPTTSHQTASVPSHTAAASSRRESQPIDIVPGTSSTHLDGLGSTISYHEDGASSESVEGSDRHRASIHAYLAQSVSSRTSGKPFIRAPERTGPWTPTGSVSSRPRKQTESESPALKGRSTMETDPGSPTVANSGSALPPPIERVPVGVSKLHNVVMPSLEMLPIYWSPIQDVANVIRATWFYQETMTPVDPSVAIMLELGYLELKAWSQTWSDQLDCAVEIGAIAEEKIVHPLWPEKQERPGTPRLAGDSSTHNHVQLAPECDDPVEKRKKTVAESCRRIEQLVDDEDVDNIARGEMPYQHPLYEGCKVIYGDEKTAYILHPSQAPAKGYKRRPLANFIRQGKTIGVPVVRGFDAVYWDVLVHEKQKQTKGNALPSASQPIPPMPKVTDLILVIHGIGQKLSERMESFHFTRAINSFRQSVNAARSHPGVEPHLREDLGGIMVLPVNWRLLLSFDDGGYADPDDPAVNQYGLDDITPKFIRSIRDIVSDVMFDVPYYFTQEHHPKMVAACISEANRIYRQWCANNPGFQTYGRVHLLAHSLGSGMAIDILSNQPTRVPEDELGNPSPSLSSTPLPTDRFLFNTSSLFICGSPVGFFLLLKKFAGLRPRADLDKPGTDLSFATMPGVAGKRGEYGCIAVENIYNIINPYDPVSYAVNGTVDKDYAASLKMAVIPKDEKSVMPLWKTKKHSLLFGPPASSLSHGGGGGTGGGNYNHNSSNNNSSSNGPHFLGTGSGFKNSFLVSTGPVGAVLAGTTSLDLPPEVELDNHNFSRESIAERRALLLNDYGQIDWYMPYGGGLFEIRYLTMLSAHSSYWINDDFIRFLVVNVGRPPGRDGCVPSLRAVRAKRVRVVANGGEVDPEPVKGRQLGRGAELEATRFDRPAEERDRDRERERDDAVGLGLSGQGREDPSAAVARLLVPSGVGDLP